jgi:hypothetical protein
METLSDFIRVLRFTTLCMLGIAGLGYLVFDTPWQFSLIILSLTLVTGLIWLNPVPLFPQGGKSRLVQELAPLESEPNPLTNAMLSYRGVKYSSHPGANRSNSNEGPLPSDVSCSGHLSPASLQPGEIIGKYRGSIIRVPSSKS